MDYCPRAGWKMETGGGVEKMKPVLIACECSQIECTAFRDAGIEAYSCDLLDCRGGHPEWHIKDDAVQVMRNGDWGLIIAHPPCTYMCLVSAPHMKKKGRINAERYEKMRAAVKFFYEFWDFKGVPMAIENPIPMAICGLPPKTQVICPSEFGHSWTKKTYLWLKDLPELLPTSYRHVGAKSYHEHTHTGYQRSRSFEGIADAMAKQWSKFIIN